MKKKVWIVGSVVVAILIISILGWKFYSYLRIKNAKVVLELKEDLTVEFGNKKKVSDFIENINGNILKDEEILFASLGKQEIKFEYINEDHIRLKKSFVVEVVDRTEPVLFLNSSYSLPVGSDMNLADKILCGDNYDATPNCKIVGEYDMNVAGSYPLTFRAEDKSGNVTEKKFTLNIYEPKPSSSTPSKEPDPILFSDIVANYKKENTKIGLDVSHWQEEIDFSKIKEAGVEFLMIRLGGTRGTNGEYFKDSRFEENIKKAKEYNIPVGIYFYSYSNSTESAKKDARWVVEQLKNYKIDLPIAYDWEEWGNFNSYHLSFFGLTSMAEAFLEEVEKAGYQGMLYSSKTYLENIWFPTTYDIWLAHYTKNTNYEGKYLMWQMTSNGKIDGIKGAVDVDILYS